MTLGACAADDPATALTNEDILGGSCSSTWCSANSPIIDHYGFWDLNLDHRRNAQGYILLAASREGEFYDLDVSDSTITLYDAFHHPMAHPLAGSTIWLQRGRQQYGIVIEGVGTIRDVILGLPLPTYVFDWSPVVARPLTRIVHAGETVEEPILPPGPGQHVCPDVTPLQGAPIEWDESIDMVPYQSLVFEGDRIHPDYTVDPAADNRWFNIGCDHHALAKLRMTRNTLNTLPTPDSNQVQATLKFLAADYCGHGTDYTVNGTPIVWHNDVGMRYMSTPHVGQLEARWDQNGAICMDTPRLALYPNPGFPTLLQSIYDECKAVGHDLPSCADSDPNSFGSELITSANH